MKDLQLIKGNVALAEAAIQAGCRYYFGYPITPQNDIPEYLSEHLPKAGGIFIQAESEIASINMVMGASASGARAMTSSSGPGISLMQEGMSYMAGSEIPCLVVNIMRCGPGLGGISPTQGDYFQATRGGGHGDYYNIVLAPASVQEMFNLTIKAFELADKYRNPAMILADAILGQMKEPASLEPTEPIQFFDKPWAITGAKDHKPQYLKTLYLNDGEQEAHNLQLKEKYDHIRENEPLYEEQATSDAEIVIVAFGTASRIVKTAIKLAREEGIRAGLVRPITLFPFPSKAVYEASKRVRKVLVVEMNTGQMLTDVQISAHREADIHFYGRPGGGVPTPEEVLAEIKRSIHATAGIQAP
ncbi:MAG: 3-methyl-2-oxobutanoate dehydrogenase subunit VorB [Candidatus Abyssobacteria bacterium SURF_5]|uniref:3-methyl-2-oxobutanoate dehydrogenase subunit VorB n=1 Tax=Abyssobacteria bacterium (strain SURF_5) TaxID=2093360 RepID=A0A3A4NP83_ABYX5|nr:MAG: 3-methyl-2-oxobutanoate dehydrogenase subunit VorB [Candidatus Abyssubacteria bacterium SURF_5]